MIADLARETLPDVGEMCAQVGVGFARGNVVQHVCEDVSEAGRKDGHAGAGVRIYLPCLRDRHVGTAVARILLSVRHQDDKGLSVVGQRFAQQHAVCPPFDTPEAFTDMSPPARVDSVV